MSSDIFDNSHLFDIGSEYEYFIGAYFEIIHKCFVIYQGRLLGEEDSGIDLIAVSRSKTYLVQCKNYRRSLIHENAVNQLGGSARSFSQRFPEARNVTPVIFTTTDFDAQAQFAAEANSVQLNVMNYEKKTVGSRLVFYNNILTTEGHHSPTYDLPLPADYEQFVRQALSRCAPSSEGRHAAPEPVQTAPKPNQVPVKAEQTSVKPNHSDLVPLVDETPSISARDWFIHEHPLKFHNFLRFFVIPFNILSIILSSLAIDGAVSPLVVICTYTVPVLFGVAFIAGSIKFEKWCYYVVHIYCWLNFAVMALLSFTGVMLIPAIICLIWTRCVTDYYKKRKPLFFEDLLPAVPSYINASDMPDRKKQNILLITIYCVFAAIIGFLAIIGYVEETTSNTPSIQPSQVVTASPAPTVKPTATPTPKPQRTTASLPANGAKRMHLADLTQMGAYESELTINTPSSDDYYCIVLVMADDPSRKWCSLFAYPGKTVTFNVPYKDCLVYYTYGPADSWYGFTDYFGSQGRWIMSDEVFEFDTYTYELTLYKVEGGNWDTDYVDEAQVPFLN